MCNTLNAILSELKAEEGLKEDLLERLDAVLTRPPPDTPEYLLQVFTQAREVFEDEAARWISQPHWSLGNQIPLEAAQTAEGAQCVKDLITRIANGLPV